MAQTHAQIRDLIESILQDSSNAVWSAATIDLHIESALSEIARYVPYEALWTLTIEGRTGSATATTANALVDTGNSQFVSGDTGKRIYNYTDKTWADVTAFVSSSQLTLSKDIMTSGEYYKMFNKNCWNNRQINIEDLKDWLQIIHAEYPISYYPHYYHNVKLLDGKRILEIDMARTPDDTSITDADKDAHLYTQDRHRLNPMTDLAGAVDLGAGYAAGSTSMVIDALQASGTVYEGDLFTVDSVRGIYRVKADATIASNEATVTFFPGLLDAAVDNDVVDFVGSTLTPELEEILANLVAGRCAISQARAYINTVPKGGTGTYTEMLRWGQGMLGDALLQLRRMSKPKVYVQYPR